MPPLIEISAEATLSFIVAINWPGLRVKHTNYIVHAKVKLSQGKSAVNSKVGACHVRTGVASKEDIRLHSVSFLLSGSARRNCYILPSIQPDRRRVLQGSRLATFQTAL